MDATHSEAPHGPVNADLIAGLREVADWLEAHADAGLPEFTGFLHASVYGASARETLTRFADLLGDRATEEATYGSVRIRRQFPHMVLEMRATANDVGGEKIERIEYQPIIAREAVSA